MYKDIIENWRKYCIKDNFIGIGSTRKAFKFSNYVIKLHLHPIGHKQSQNELKIYNVMNENGLHELFAETYYVDNKFSIQKYYHPLELIDNQSFEINTTQHANLWGNGYATEAAQAILQFAFNEKEYHKVFARSFHSNPASERVLQKIGMEKEGVLSEHVIKEGHYEDLVYYGIINSDSAK